MSGAVSVELTRTTDAKASEWTIAGGMELVAGQQTTVLGTPDLQFLLDPAPDGDPGPRRSTRSW